MPKLTLPSGEVLSETDVERVLEILTRGIIQVRIARNWPLATPEQAANIAGKLLDQLTTLEKAS